MAEQIGGIRGKFADMMTLVFGSFADKAKVRQILREAQKQLGAHADAGRPTLAPKSYSGVKQWSAMILGLTEAVAGKACKALWARNAYCLGLRPEVLGNKDGVWRCPPQSAELRRYPPG